MTSAFAAQDLFFDLFHGERVEVGMRVGVISQFEPSGHPALENLRSLNPSVSARD